MWNILFERCPRTPLTSIINDILTMLRPFCQIFHFCFFLSLDETTYPLKIQAYSRILNLKKVFWISPEITEQFPFSTFRTCLPLWKHFYMQKNRKRAAKKKKFFPMKKRLFPFKKSFPFLPLKRRKTAAKTKSFPHKKSFHANSPPGKPKMGTKKEPSKRSIPFQMA